MSTENQLAVAPQNQVANRRTHGLSRSPEYVSWCKMIQRCTNPKENNFSRYGAIGITVHPEWRYSFENFLLDMGPKPSPSHTIDRKNSLFGYSADNCKWSDKTEQSSNRKSCRHIFMGGRTLTLAAWCRELGLNYDVTRQRIARDGWRTERALSTPTN